MKEYSDEQIYEAMRQADAAGDADAVRALMAALQSGASQPEIEAMADERGLKINPDQLAANIGSRDAGGPVNVILPPQRSVGQDLATSAVNIPVGLVQGVGESLIDFPLFVSHAVQNTIDRGISFAGEKALAALGFDKQANALAQNTQQVIQRRNALATPVADVFNEYAPAPKGFETQRDVARFVGGFLVPGPKGAKGAKGAKALFRAPKPAAPAGSGRLIDDAAGVVAEGQRRGVPVFTTDVKPPKSGAGRYFKQTLPEKIPFAGTSGPRRDQQAERIRVVGDVLEEFGGNASRELFDNSGGVVDDIAKSISAERSKRLTTLSNAKNSVIDGVPGSVATPRAVAAIDRQIDELGKLGAAEVRPVIARLQSWKSALTGETQRIDTGILDASGNPIIREIAPERTLRVIEDLRKIMGESFKDPNLAGIRTIGEKSLNAIYGPLREDMGSFIQQQAGAGARNRWSKANKELAAMAGELSSARFRNVLRDADTTPEVVGRILFDSPDNVSDAARLVANLPPEGRKKVQAALLQRAFDRAGGSSGDGVSVERFLNNLNSLSGKIGVAFEGADRQALEGVRRLLEATRRGAAAGANIRTGEQNLPAVMGIAATQTLGLTGGVASLGVGGLLARIYESAPMRNHIMRLASTRAGSPQEAKALQVLIRSAAPIVNQWRETLPRALNDNPAGRLAAEEQQTQEPQ